MLDYIFFLFTLWVLKASKSGKLLSFLLLVFIILLLVWAWRQWWKPSRQKSGQSLPPVAPTPTMVPPKREAEMRPPTPKPEVAAPKVEVAVPEVETRGAEAEVGEREVPSEEVSVEVPEVEAEVVVPEIEAEAEVPVVEEVAVPEVEATVEVPEVEPAVVVPAVEAVQADDLTRIEGIGPKISSILQEAGIRTFAQLAATPVSELQAILSGKVRIFFPDTWPEQAELAARGAWEDLAKLQEGLKGGRRRQG